MPALTTLPPTLRRVPFTAAQARTAGLSARALQGPAVREVFERVYLSADIELTLPLEVSAARLVLPPGSVVGGVTALRLLGLEVGARHPLRFWTTWPCQVRRPGITVSRVARLGCNSAGLLGGAEIFRTAATALDLADLVAAGDFLVRRGRASTSELTEIAHTGGRGRVRARWAAELVRERVDSPRETRLRLMLVLAGLPEPQVNLALHDAGGAFLGTPDLTLRRWRIVIEYEGDQHRTDPRQWAYDLRRYESMAAAGHLVIRVSNDHVKSPRDLVRRVHRALVGRGYEGPAPTFDDAWVEIFESTARYSTRNGADLVE